jgi:hypothetical protein
MTKYAGFIYEWTNKINNMKYIGAHTGSEDDGYIGGGKRFRIALREHGFANFERKILEYVNDATKIKDRENHYLGLYDVVDDDTYYNSSSRSSGLRVKQPTKQVARSLCCVCEQRPVAVNYIKDDITHYRTKCDACLKKKKNPRPFVPRWKAAGYKKKMSCDCCGFKARWSAQMLVFHVDGNLAHNDLKNLRSVCKNCEINLQRSDSVWKIGDLEPDN